MAHINQQGYSMLYNLIKIYTEGGAVNNKIYIKDDFPKLAAIFPSQHHCQFDGSRPGNFREEIVRVRAKAHKNNYTPILHSLSQNKDLSLEALGLAVKILSLPADWELHKKYFETEKNGRYQINRIFKELRELGYAEVVNIYERNRIKDRQWVVYEDPENDNENFRKENVLNTGLSTLRKPSVKTNQQLQSNKTITNNNIIQKGYVEKILKDEKKKGEQIGLWLKYFEEYWDNRPGRGKGSNSKAYALKLWLRRMKEAEDPLKIIKAMKFYKICCQQDGIINTRGSMQASTFIGEQRHYETDWEAKAYSDQGKKPKTEEEIKQEKQEEDEKLRIYQEKFWEDNDLQKQG